MRAYLLPAAAIAVLSAYLIALAIFLPPQHRSAAMEYVYSGGSDFCAADGKWTATGGRFGESALSNNDPRFIFYSETVPTTDRDETGKCIGLQLGKGQILKGK